MHGLRTEWYKSGHKWSEQVMEYGYVVSGKHFYNDGSEITHGNIINCEKTKITLFMWCIKFTYGFGFFFFLIFMQKLKEQIENIAWLRNLGSIN